MSRESALHERLWASNTDLARACLDHPFVRGLADGSLPTDTFEGYVAQDAFFLRAFIAAYCVAAAKCAAYPERVAVFHRLIGGALEELELHAAYADSLGIDLDRVRPHAATSAYTDFLSRTAWTGGPAETMAAMTPCMRLYAFLGRSLAPGAPDNAYRDWIDTYSSDAFGALATELERLLDGMDEDGPPVRDAYRYAMECEVAFFDAALAGGAARAATDP